MESVRAHRRVGARLVEAVGEVGRLVIRQVNLAERASLVLGTAVTTSVVRDVAGEHSNQKDNDAHQIKDDVVRRANVKSEVGAEVGVAKLLVVARQKARLVRKRLEATEIIASDLGLDEVQIDALQPIASDVYGESNARASSTLASRTRRTSQVIGCSCRAAYPPRASSQLVLEKLPDGTRQQGTQV
eukprot:6175444-Pleurochrysis_carterae.AAC.1